MMQEKREVMGVRGRAGLGINLVKMNSFLLTKQKHPSSQPQQLPTPYEHKSLRIRFKSQKSPQKQPPSLSNSQALSFHRPQKQMTNSVTFRILKWSKLKNNKNQLAHAQGGAGDRSRRRSEALERSSLYNLRNISLQKCLKKSIKRLSPRSKDVESKGEDTMRIIDNYKLTQRIVFFEQLQQKKDRQRHLQHPKRKFGSSLRSEELKKPEVVKIQQNEAAKAYRPWSGQSIHSHHSQHNEN